MIKKPFGFVYSITNRITEMCYIGISIGNDINNISLNNKQLQADITKFGIVNFDKKVLSEADNILELSKLEKIHLESAKSLSLYNTSMASSVRLPEYSVDRPICPICNVSFVAINCKKNNKTYYRLYCDRCIRHKRRKKITQPNWSKAGYKKKPACDRCGFRAKHHSQLLVYHVNGNTDDCELRNLKTICLNCTAEIIRLDLPWSQGGIEPDR